MSADIFTPIPKIPEPGEWRWDKPSLAVVARGDDGCAVLCHVGPHVRQQIEDLGSNNEEIFESDPPMGISIFEGKLAGGRKVWSSLSGDDYEDVYLAGEFRTPSADEWSAIREGDCPWNPDDWIVPGLATELEMP